MVGESPRYSATGLAGEKTPPVLPPNKAKLFCTAGPHRIRVADGFDPACKVAIEHLDKTPDIIEFSTTNTENLFKTAMTSLGSRMYPLSKSPSGSYIQLRICSVSKEHDKFSRIAVEAVMTVAHLDRKDVSFDLIKVDGKVGGSLADATLTKGVPIDKDMSRSQISHTVRKARLAILTCPFGPPQPKTKHKLDITSAEEYKKL